MTDTATDRYRGLPPGPDLPPRQQAARWASRPLEFGQELQKRFGDVFTVRLEAEPWVVVADHDLVRQIFATPADVLHAGEGNRVLAPLFGPTSLPLADGERHASDRRLLMGPFRGERLSGYEQTIRELTAAAVGGWPRAVAFPIWPSLQRLTLEAILRIVLGGMPADDRRALGERMQDVRLPAAPGQRISRARFERVLARPHELIAAEVRRRRGARGDQEPDVLDLLLDERREDGSPLTEIELRDELAMLLVTGHETTATALAWLIEHLVHHPAALGRVAAEASEGGGPYTDAAIRETLRLRPPLPLIGRRAKQPFRLGDHLLPAETIVTPSLLLIQHRPDLFVDPLAFRPERFLDRQTGTQGWIPFGGGSRRCIGSQFAPFEMRAVVSTLLQQVEPRPAVAGREAMRSRAATLTPAKGVPVILEPRAS